jgi:hypothetical protein
MSTAGWFGTVFESAASVTTSSREAVVFCLPQSASASTRIGAEGRGVSEDDTTTEVPHFLQNLAPGNNGVAHNVQLSALTSGAGIVAPHDLQNLAPYLFSTAHLLHIVIEKLPLNIFYCDDNGITQLIKLFKLFPSGNQVSVCEKAVL